MAFCSPVSAAAFVHTHIPLTTGSTRDSNLQGAALSQRTACRRTSLQPRSSRGRRAARVTVPIRATLTQPPTPSSAPSASDGGGGGGDADTDVLVIGSGVSGTALAYTLHRDHPSTRVILTEARDVVGGNVISRQANGYTWEEGPNTFQPAAHILRLAIDVGLKDDLVFADHTLPRFVFWDDKLYALPLSPKDIPKFRLLSPWGAVRAGLGAMGFVRPYFGNDESIKQFISRHLGKEVFQKMIDPFVSGVYAGDPAKLCMSAAFKKIFALQNLGGSQGIVEGAIIRISQRSKEAKANPMDEDIPKWKPGALGSFRNGLSMLPNAIVDRLTKTDADNSEQNNSSAVRLQWTLTDVCKLPSGMYRATYDTPSGTQSITAKAVAVTAPARAASSILSGVAPGVARLQDIYYPTVWSVTLAYPSSEFKMQPLKGFGNLIPRSMGIRTLGTIWSSALFPGRAPPGMELLLSYIGGAQDPDIAKLTEQEVIDVVDADIKKILLKEGSTVTPVVVGARKWDRAIPQYNIGYWEIMEEAESSLQENSCDGVFLGGNYTSGVAFGDCVLWGTETAPKIAKYVEQFSPVNVKDGNASATTEQGE